MWEEYCGGRTNLLFGDTCWGCSGWIATMSVWNGSEKKKDNANNCLRSRFFFKKKTYFKFETIYDEKHNMIKNDISRWLEYLLLFSWSRGFQWTPMPLQLFCLQVWEWSDTWWSRAEGKQWCQHYSVTVLGHIGTISCVIFLLNLASCLWNDIHPTVLLGKSWFADHYFETGMWVLQHLDYLIMIANT